MTKLNCNPWEPEGLLTLTHMCSDTWTAHSCLVLTCHPFVLSFFLEEAVEEKTIGTSVCIWMKSFCHVKTLFERKKKRERKRHCEWMIELENIRWNLNWNLLTKTPRYEDPCCPDMGIPYDGARMDFHSLHYGNGRLEDHRNRWYGGLVHHQGGMVLVQSVESLFYRLNSCQQLLWLPHALICWR